MFSSGHSKPKLLSRERISRIECGFQSGKFVPPILGTPILGTPILGTPILGTRMLGTPFVQHAELINHAADIKHLCKFRQRPANNGELLLRAMFIPGK